MDATERRKRARAEAADWFVRLQADDLPRSASEEYVDWLRDSPTHVAEMLRIAQVHGALEEFRSWARISTDGPEADPKIVSIPTDPVGRQEGRAEQERAVARGRTRVRLFALAATVAVVLLATAVLLPNIGAQVIDTERGERREVVLSDGSVVQVDPQTRLRVKLEDHIRQVYLERGRALFHVAKNPDRPFLVHADDTTVRAVGTAFGVERQRERIVVTVAEGKVAVLPATPSDGTKATSSAQRLESSSAIFLGAGQQLTVEKSRSAAPVRAVDSTRELAWAEGRLIFENTRVSEVIEEFNRYNRVQLHVTDETLANRPVSAVFSASDPESFIAFIQTVTPVHVIRRDETDITLSASNVQ